MYSCLGPADMWIGLLVTAPQVLRDWGANSIRGFVLEESGLSRGVEENRGKETNLGCTGPSLLKFLPKLFSV